MIIGLAAYRFINNDTAFNLSQMEKAMKSARGKADLVCFGETFLQGFDALSWDYEYDKAIAVTQDSEIIEKLAAFTCQYGVDLLFGYIERAGEQLYSSCMLLSEGKVLHNYRRMSIGWKEYSRTDGHYCEGECAEDFVYRDRKMRIALCGDLWEFPEKFKTDGLLLWPVYVNFSLPEWQQYEQEYAQQAALAASKTLLVNSISRDPDALGGAFCFENGCITDRLPYGTENILYIEV